ncbi:FAD-dependent oxidoreductase [Candidatus Woesearchaeota archaeon]|nr:FAD-dependent oxidoreductase [Candidatus Woesearchaeota archaeon]
MDKKESVVIVGGGPAALFAAYELANTHDVTIIDKGRDIERRGCPSPDECNKKCRPCSILCGVGGAGLFSDGKVIFHTKIGNNLSEIVGEEKNAELVRRVEEMFNNYGIIVDKLGEKKEAKIKETIKKAKEKGIDFIYTRQAHIGTDHLKEFIKKLRDDLRLKGVKFVCGEEVVEVAKGYVKTKNQRKISYDHLLLAPGRVGAAWLEKIVNSLQISHVYNPIDIGVRVEIPKKISEAVTSLVRDMKFQMNINRSEVRTFCTCPGGKVTRENHEGFTLVNGHSESGDPGSNTNFALLVKVTLDKPLANTNEYGREVASLANTTGKGKIILQRLGDLKMERRSHKEENAEHDVVPSLNDVVYGDISLALPGKIINKLIQGLEKLDKIMPGIADDSTILYAPEIKFHGLRILTGKQLETNVKNVYAAGDGAGLSRGIAGAAASGILAAEGIKNKG